MKGSTKRTIFILFSLAMLVGSVVVYKSLVSPAYEKTLKLKADKIGLENKYNNYTALNEQFQAIFNEYKNLGDLEKEISKYLPPRLDVSYAMNQIIGIARLNNIEIQSLNLKPLAIKASSEKSAKGLGILRIDMKLNGSYDNFKLFLNSVENNIMISKPVSFKIESRPNAFVLSYALTIDTFYQAE